MAEELHLAAAHHLPSFITAPGETDVLMVVMGGILAVSVLAFGLLYLRLHSLPERMAHKTHKLQFEIVAVLGLISLFTHMHIFWIIGLVLAMIELPDFGTSLNRIAGSTEKIAGLQAGEGAVEIASEAPAVTKQLHETGEASPQTPADQNDGVVVVSPKPEIAPPTRKELIHA